MDFSERSGPSMYFSFSDVEQNSYSFVDNISQEEERQAFMAFIEKYKAKL